MWLGRLAQGGPARLAMGAACASLLAMNYGERKPVYPLAPVEQQTQISTSAGSQTVHKTGVDPRKILKVEFDVDMSSLLGKGTFGTVRKAKEITTGKQVALKVVGKNAKPLSHEIEALKKVRNCGSHPNIVSLLGVVDIEGEPTRFGLVFELMEGGELYESLVENGAYSESQASSIIRQVASALAFLHEECRLAHADLKPENLLLRKSPSKESDNFAQIALCDFGSAVDLDENGRFELSSSRLLGTVAYAAPELLAPEYSDKFLRKTRRHLTKEYATSEVDIWSLGCILYVILSGMHPFDPDNELLNDDELAKAMLRGQYDFNALVWRDVSASAKDLIKRMLEKDPAKRITAREVLQHDWIRLPQRTSLISNSDVRLIGFLRTQKRLQDHVFHLMVDGSLRNTRAKSNSNANIAEEQRALSSVYKTFDTEGKGFITKQDLERALSKTRGSSAPSEEAPDNDEDKLYYSSLNGLVGCGERVVYEPGSVVFNKGDPADAFYFVDRGSVEVCIVKERNVAVQISAGDFFGETALINNQPRNATIIAGPEGAELIRFSRDDFERLVTTGSDTFKIVDEQVKKRTVEHIKYVFSSLFHDKKAVQIDYGSVLLKRGEPSDSMYFITDGAVDVISATGKTVAQRKEGETVGELGLVTGEPRSMDIVCATPTGCSFKRFSPLAHAELTKVLSARGDGPAIAASPAVSPNGEKRIEREMKRRWTVIQGSAKMKGKENVQKKNESMPSGKNSKSTKEEEGTSQKNAT